VPGASLAPQTLWADTSHHAAKVKPAGFRPSILVVVQSDNTITIVTARSVMGTGIATSLPKQYCRFADELAHAAGSDPLDYPFDLIGPQRILDLNGADYPNYPLRARLLPEESESLAYRHSFRRFVTRSTQQPGNDCENCRSPE
jgi:hypothetical protein